MAFLRFSRDKRGYEHFYLVEPVTNRKGKSRPRVLYWYRTPPNVRVGRVPFDDEVRRALEARYPGVTFDWTKIVDAPIPSAEAERWRERRRTERAERAARKSTPGETGDEEIAAAAEPVPDVVEGDGDGEDQPPADAVGQTTDVPPDESSGRKRRRRRRGRPEIATREPSVAAPPDSTRMMPDNQPDSQVETPPDDPIEPPGE